MNKGEKKVSLILYGPPEVVTEEELWLERILTKDEETPMTECLTSKIDKAGLMMHTCREAEHSVVEIYDILRAISPAIEWEEEGNLYRQYISSEPSSRSDVIRLNKMMNEQLNLRQARKSGICPVRREIYKECFNELIRQVTVSQPERGLLLLRVRDELYMTLNAYIDLYSFASSYDSRNTVCKESAANTKDTLEKFDKLLQEVVSLKKQKEKLMMQYTEHEIRNKESRDARLHQQYDMYQFLKRVNNSLKQHIDWVENPASIIDTSSSVEDIEWGKKTKKTKCKY